MDLANPDWWLVALGAAGGGVSIGRWAYRRYLKQLARSATTDDCSDKVFGHGERRDKRGVLREEAYPGLVAIATDHERRLATLEAASGGN